MASSNRQGPFFQFSSKRLQHGVKDGLSDTLMIGEQVPSTLLEGHECLVFHLAGIPGLSPGGANEFMNGRVISDSKDRRILADILLKDLGYPNLAGETTMSVLLPAVQAARHHSYQGWGPWEVNPSSRLSDAGALQFLSGNPVLDPKDRSNIFAVWLTVGYFNRPSTYTWAYTLRRR